jgi:hypothetical protein
LKNVSVLVETIFNKEEDEQERDACFEIMANYDAAMEILRKQSEYTDDDIEKFQDHVDVLFQQ